MTKPRVAITGIASLCGLGHNIDEVWKNLINGKCCIKSHPELRSSVKIAGRPENFQIAENLLTAKEQDRFDLFIHYALHCAHDALNDSNSQCEKTLQQTYNSQEMGCILGVGMGGFPFIEKEHKDFLNRPEDKLRTSAFFIPSVIPNMASGMCAMKFGLQGVNYAIASACASSGHAIESAFQHILLGKQKVMVTGGAEAVTTDFTLTGFNSMKALSRRQVAPEQASCPFSLDRDGFVMGEGSAIIVLEDYHLAQQRGAKILAEIVGTGSSADAYHITAPHPEAQGAEKSMNQALAQAGIEAREVGYINAHGTSTPTGDIAETVAIKKIWGEAARDISISSTKSMTGHLLGAASALESVICVKTLLEQMIPPTINLNNPDPQCDLDYTPHSAKSKCVTYALNNSFGFGGTNSSIIFKRGNL